METLLGHILKPLSSFAEDRLLKELNYLVTYQSNVNKLEEVARTLRIRIEEKRHKVDEEEGRYQREIEDYVKEWLHKADKVISEYDAFQNEDDRERAGCSDAFLPNPVTRSRRSKKAEEITGKAKEVLQDPAADAATSHFRAPPSMGVAFSNVDYVPFDSRKDTMEKIKAALENSNVRMIGVDGLNGVGKTTLVIEAAKQVKLFDVVVIANVTKKPDIRKIQGQIADMLGMKLEEETEYARAVRIKERLKKEKENTLIILDDLWAKLDLNMLGIPSQNDDGSQKNLKEGKTPGASQTEEEKKEFAGASQTEEEKKEFAGASQTEEEKKEFAGASQTEEEKKEFAGASQTEEEKKEFAVASNKMKKKKSSGASSKFKEEEPPSHFKGCKIVLISVMRQVLLSQMNGKGKFFSVEVLKEKEPERLFKKMAEIDDNNSDEFKKLAGLIAHKCNGLPMSIITTARALKNHSRPVWEDILRQLERGKLIEAPELSIELSYGLLENEELKNTFLLCARMGRDALIMDLVKYCIGLGFLQGIYTVWEARDRVLALLVKLKESSLLSDSYSSDRFTMQDIVRNAALSIASKEKHVFTLTKGKLDEWPDEEKLERYTAISLQHCDIIEEFPESINCPRLRVFHVDNNDPHLKIPDKFFEGMRELRVLTLTGIHLSPLPLSIRCLTKLRMLCLEQCMLDEQLSIIGELKKLRILSLSGSDIEKLPVELKQLAKLQIFDISNCSKLKVIPPNVISSLTSLEELYMRNNLIEWKFEGQTNQSENASLSELRHLNQLTTIDIQIPNVTHLPENLFFDKLYNYKIVIGDLNAYLERDFKMPEKYEASRFLSLQLKDGFDIHSQKGIKMLFERVENLLLGELNRVHDMFGELNLKGFLYLRHLSVISNSDIKYIINSMDWQFPDKAFSKLESIYLYKLHNMEQICNASKQPIQSRDQIKLHLFCKLKIIKIKICCQLKNVFLSSMVKFFAALETIEVSECNSLKEIITMETQSSDNKIAFPELRSLMLHALSEFIGFYPISPSTTEQVQSREPRELFNEKVEVPKLERMELSSIKIHNLWRGQSLPKSYFQNLIHLGVNDCGNLTSLFSFSMAKSLENLQSLLVSECEKMVSIFASDAEMKPDSIFPKLKNIKLSSMKSLREIWISNVPLGSFGKLDTLIIEVCHKFVNVFPCYMVRIFRSLRKLRVTHCKSMKEIIDLDDKKQDAIYVNLQDVHLEALPKLKHMWRWNKDRKGINLKNLQKVWVRECDNLENIFPVSTALCLENLEYLGVWDCLSLKEIVAKGEGTSTYTSDPIQFEFPKLTIIKFSELPKLKSFYPGEHKLSCPALNDLSVELCAKLELFGKETAHPIRKPVFSHETVINKLKSMQIEWWDAESLRSYTGNYRMTDLEELHLSGLSVKHTEILYFFLHSNPNLKSLWLNDCYFEELVPRGRLPAVENLGVVPKLKSLKLIRFPSLKEIGFERDAVLQRIECLILKECDILITLVPPSVSFTHLTNLEVVNCDKLRNLMAPSTAKSLVQLSTVKVIQCELMEEIVSEQENEEENAVEIVFRQLKALELGSLYNLKSFCSSKSCAFQFPSLEKLVVSACPKMQNFCEKVESSPVLRKVYVVHREENQRWYWKGDINATIQKLYKHKIFFEGMDELTISDHLDLRDVWQSDVGLKDSNWFDSLKTLKLENCKLGPCAIPSNVLPGLKSLKELQVWSCDNVKVIFDINDTEVKGTALQLKNLTLCWLPNLTHVWEWDKNNREGILSFQNFEEVDVSYCESLKTLFPAALAKNLNKLENLDIERCNQLPEIVGKEEAAAAEATEKFRFPRLTKLNLFELPQLTHFYPARFTLECPVLNSLEVYRCNSKLQLFQSQQEAHPEGQGGGTSINRQSLLLDQKVLANLEVLTLNWINTLVLTRFGQFPKNDQLNELNLCFDDDVNEGFTLPFEILKKAPNLENIEIRRCSGIKEIFPSQIGENENGMLGNLRALFLYELSGLQSLGLKYSSWLNKVCEKLHQLRVRSCHRLRTLIHSQVSFSSLQELRIVKCDRLEYLFTSSTAKKLIHLEEMRIKECKSLKEIVAQEQDDETTSEEIKFERLERTVLEHLSSLECFYSGNATLQFPSLIQVDILSCPKMKIFSQGPIHAKSFRGTLDSVLQDNLNEVERRS